MLGKPSEILPSYCEADDLCDSEYTPSNLTPRSSVGLLKRAPSSQSLQSDHSITYDRMAHSADFINKPENPLAEFNEEHQHQGSISSDVYKAYFMAVGRTLSVLVLISLFCMQASKNASDLWLAHWVSETGNHSSPSITTTTMGVPTFLPSSGDDGKFSLNSSYNVVFRNAQDSNDPFEESDSVFEVIGNHIPMVRDLEPDVKYYFTVFILIGVANSVFTLARAFMFAYGGVQGGTKIHLSLLRVVLKVIRNLPTNKIIFNCLLALNNFAFDFPCHCL